MTILVNYPSKKELKACVGQKLRYRETAAFGPEYKSTGKFAVVRRPHLLGGGREFFAEVTMENDIIIKVE